MTQEAHEHHTVHFYASEKSLFTTVAGFLGKALVDGQPAILFATAAHRTPILESLKRLLIDVDQAQRAGDLILVDAHRALSTFMVDRVPNAAAFEANVGTIISDVLKRRAPGVMIRAYGEMVDVLWKGRQFEAAIRLEMLWNKLAKQFGFALLCSYAMGAFYKQTEQCEEVLRQHAHVLPPSQRDPRLTTVRNEICSEEPTQ
ncbi:MAG TPA: MEDS domain-containing protein [Vicinamibacterales bacterium]|nr:MEDS domain-containing protein [Vicinamibacterales bacterium]